MFVPARCDQRRRTCAGRGPLRRPNPYPITPSEKGQELAATCGIESSEMSSAWMGGDTHLYASRS